MAKLTEYHNGVAVIKDKRFKEAAEKLAFYEDKYEKGLLHILPDEMARDKRCEATDHKAKYFNPFIECFIKDLQGGGSDE